MHLSVFIFNKGLGGFELKIILWVKCPTLGPSYNWSKKNKFPITPPTKTRGQMCFIERKNIPTF